MRGIFMNRTSILALLLTALLLTGCGGTATTETTADTQADTAVQETETTNPLEVVQAAYADRDYGGYDFRIIDRSGEVGTTFATVDVYAEELTGEAINDAVYNRNNMLEETMKVKVVEIGSTDVLAGVKESVLAGTDDYDLANYGISFFAGIVTQNMLADYRQISTIQADAAYWDQLIYSDCAIMGKSFFMTGDISIMDNYGTWCFLFNKDMIRDHGLENPYTLVDEGKWTLDKLDEMASVAVNDTNGDGAWTNEDTYGFCTEEYNVLTLWGSAGYRILDIGQDGKPVFGYNSEDSLDSLVKILEIQFAPYTNLGTKSTVNTGNIAVENSREQQFAFGRSLFYYAGMVNITSMREFDTDFGVLPAPKKDEAQPEYRSSYSCYNMTVYSIPVTVTDLSRTGDIMDAMAHMSLYTLTPAYYDRTLIGKSTRDEESKPMIDLILRSRNFDLGVLFNTGNVRNTISGMTKPDTVASSLKSLEKSANTDLDKLIADIESMK